MESIGLKLYRGAEWSYV